jgi:hypothetical protein
MQGVEKLNSQRLNSQLINEQMNWTDSSQKKKYKWPINSQKMLNILDHKGSANQNDTETSPHSSQNGYDQ